MTTLNNACNPDLNFFLSFMLILRINIHYILVHSHLMMDLSNNFSITTFKLIWLIVIADVAGHPGMPLPLAVSVDGCRFRMNFVCWFSDGMSCTYGVINFYESKSS